MNYRIFYLIFVFAVSMHRTQGQRVFSSTVSHDRNKEDLRMNFPGIYFKHNSTEYAAMPYSVDSCFKYITLHIKDIYSFDIWRDSLETEELTSQRIKKLKSELNRYLPSKKIEINSMRDEQKVYRRTIEMGAGTAHIEYLRSLNSVFDISKTRHKKKRKAAISHERLPRLWCSGCWRHGFYFEYRRNMRQIRKMEKNKKLKAAALANIR